MSLRLSWARTARNAALSVALCAWALVLSDTSWSAEPLRETTSLKWAPADASFYFSVLRLREQYDAVARSKAMARLLEIPAVQWTIEAMKSPPGELSDPQVVTLSSLLSAPENQELLALLADAVSQEVFVYGDGGFAESFGDMVEMIRQGQEAEFQARQAGEDTNLAATRKITELLAARGDRLKVPDAVIGFRISDANRAETQLTRLEALLREHLGTLRPELAQRMSRERIGNSEFLTLKLDGSLIPWDEAPVRDLGEEHREHLDKLAATLKNKTLTVSLGIHDGYLLLSVGDTSEHLATLGQGKLLWDQPELAPLRKAGDKPFTAVYYVSQKYRENAAQINGQLDQYVRAAEQLLPESGLDEELQKELLSDARLLAEDLKRSIPRPGAVLAFGFLSPRGREGFAYDWSQQLSLDGSQKLSILDHVGGDPLAFSASRRKHSPEAYALWARWLARGVYYAEQIGLPQLEPPQRELAERLRADLDPLARRLDQTIRQQWIPAFADGQGAFVLDAKLTSAQWQNLMPESKQPLPLPEIGLVYRITDAEKVKQASGEFFAIAGEALKKLHAQVPDTIPEIELTAPASREFPEGTVYFYALPEGLGVDARIAPNAGLSKDVLALSLAPKFSLRLLTPTPLQGEGPLSRRDRPLAAASFVHWAGIVDLAGKWINYGIDVATQPPADPEDDDAQGNAAGSTTLKLIVKPQVTAALEVLKCLRSTSSVTYVEDGAHVTHSEWHLQDLP